MQLICLLNIIKPKVKYEQINQCQKRKSNEKTQQILTLQKFLVLSFGTKVSKD